MPHLSLNLPALFVVMTIFSQPVISSDSDVLPERMSLTDVDSEKVLYEAGRNLVTEKARDDVALNNKNPAAEIATMVGEPASSDSTASDLSSDLTGELPAAVTADKEEVWVEISQAISGLNDMVGDEMFRDLRRVENNRMEVRVDVHFWQRVRYETRVDLKNDISNIWHLYVLQYGGEDDSIVYFIDDDTNKTIDIFSQYQ